MSTRAVAFRRCHDADHGDQFCVVHPIPGPDTFYVVPVANAIHIEPEPRMIELDHIYRLPAGTQIIELAPGRRTRPKRRRVREDILIVPFIIDTNRPPSRRRVSFFTGTNRIAWCPASKLTLEGVAA